MFVDAIKTSADGPGRMTAGHGRTSGIQSIARAARVLRCLAMTNGSAGVRFSQLQESTALSKGTLHRIVQTLMAEGFVEQDRSTRLYFLGLEFLALGARTANRQDIQSMAAQSLLTLAKLSGDTVYLAIRSGPDLVCVDAAEGSYPIKVLTLSVGMRRPLGVGAGGLVLLADLPDSDIDRVLRQNSRRLKDYSFYQPEMLKRLVAETRARGYGVNEGHILQGMCAVSVGVYGAQKQLLGALTIAATAERMAMPRRATLIGYLRREAQKITAMMTRTGTAS